MNVEAIPRFLRDASFREIVWLAPLAYAVHILEELWRFPLWASTHFAPGLTTQRFVVGNALIMLGLLGLTVLVSTVRIMRAAHREGRIGNAAGVVALVVGAAAMFSLAYFGLVRRAPVSA